LSSSRAEGQANVAGIEFFEKRIRPVLVENCYSCHSSDAKKIKGEVEWHWIETADHGFKPLKSSGLTVDAALAAAAADVVRFVGSL
jgi:hypothetical protein